MSKPVRILHLEDNPNDAELIHAMLVSSGLVFEAAIARSQQEFVSALEKGGFDLVISDFSIPSFDGKTALTLLRRKYPETPFLFVSGTIGEEAAIEALLAGATDYVLKDNLRRLAPSVQRALREAAERKERKRAEETLQTTEEQLRQAQKMEAIGRLAGGVAHDFNNLLTAILGLADLSIKELPPENSVRKDIEEIKQTALRAASLTQQLLAFSRKQIIRPRRVDLNEVILNLKKMLHRIIEEDIEIKIIPAASTALVRMDPNQIEQFIINMAVNARDAMPEGGTLAIQISATTLDDEFISKNAGATKGKYIALTLTDTGIGMTDEVIAHLFEPFFTTKEQGKGTGLGLATCYGIVKQNGGYIAVESSVGKGTTFKIYFPQAEGRIEPHETQIREGGSLAGAETLLVAEDEATVRRLAVRCLRAHGYTVLEAADGEQALEIINGDAEKAIRLVLSDTVMPKMGGKKLAEGIKLRRPDVRVVFFSGYTDESLARHGVLDSDVDFVAKPFEPLVLARKIREVLDRRGSPNASPAEK